MPFLGFQKFFGSSFLSSTLIKESDYAFFKQRL